VETRELLNGVEKWEIFTERTVKEKKGRVFQDFERPIETKGDLQGVHMRRARSKNGKL